MLKGVKILNTAISIHIQYFNAPVCTKVLDIVETSATGWGTVRTGGSAGLCQSFWEEILGQIGKGHGGMVFKLKGEI